MIKYLIIFFFFFNNTFASEVINITFLGVGTPRPNIDKLGPSILIKNNDEEILLDVGRGTTLRLNQIKNDFSKINNVFISHLHYDHIVGLPDLWLTSNLWQKKNDINVFGPIGIKNYCNKIQDAYKEDLKYRYNKIIGANLKCYNFQQLSKKFNGTTGITYFKNSHGNLKESYGFKITFKDKVIIYSGDTSYSENLIYNCMNCDVLIHEVISVSDEIVSKNKKLRDVIKTHTDISQLIKILNATNPKLTILNHALLFGVEESDVLNKIANNYNGKVIFSSDLMSLDVGSDINIFKLY